MHANALVLCVTRCSDHGEMLGDFGLQGKGGIFPQSYHIIGAFAAYRLPALNQLSCITRHTSLLRHCEGPKISRRARQVTFTDGMFERTIMIIVV